MLAKFIPNKSKCKKENARIWAMFHQPKTVIKLEKVMSHQEKDNVVMILVSIFMVLVLVVTYHSFPEQVAILKQVIYTILSGGAPV